MYYYVSNVHPAKTTLQLSNNGDCGAAAAAAAVDLFRAWEEGKQHKHSRQKRSWWREENRVMKIFFPDNNNGRFFFFFGLVMIFRASSLSFSPFSCSCWLMT